MTTAVTDLEHATRMRMAADGLNGETVFSKRPDLGYFRLPTKPVLSLPIRYDAPLGPWLLRVWAGPTAIYRYHADLEHPLTLVLSDGTEYQPDRTFETDMGSVPLFLQGLPGGLYQKDRWLPAYLPHDSGYTHGGLFVRRPGEAAFRFEPMGKDKVDAILYVSVLILGGPRWNASTIYWAVDRFGTGTWEQRRPVRVAWKTRKGLVA